MANVEDLAERLRLDKAFRNDLQSSKNSCDFENKLRAAGVDLQPEDFINMVRTKVGQDEGILSDDDLNSVSGGLEVQPSVLTLEEMKNWTSDVWKVVMDVFIS